MLQKMCKNLLKKKISASENIVQNGEIVFEK